ncbi:hypothetical protein L2E82_01614 [Cichorium intybus]|uniref:Uncharacterized protein n=1 Tax=Cichorium intybus TaxID=13427 RepID=A0ACB9H0I0_CICIN|nr:hypothetical protein L2E82_01614 [Cichorium intybus]
MFFICLAWRGPVVVGHCGFISIKEKIKTCFPPFPLLLESHSHLSSSTVTTKTKNNTKKQQPAVTPESDEGGWSRRWIQVEDGR